ncbi:uncharacterized protein LOC122931731 [Bufo gargarizans]|uniref:uncharacterized protein LOC122931731 n=1 Tax=Bufo gargarizans TaxID=30331 RepID=UPI001CF5D1CB|nr:uncharacterized protein LOC122931731 [Bufo gargarizans]
MDVGKLITLIQERPQLWDTRQDLYHDRIMKERAWEEITKEMLAREWEKGNSSKRRRLVLRVKTRWQSCRDQYRRERVQGLGKSGDGGPRKKPYLYTNQLHFLKPVLDLRPTVDSLEQEGDQSSTNSDEDAGAHPLDSTLTADDEPQPVLLQEREESSALEGPSAAIQSSPETRRRQPRRRRGPTNTAVSASNTQALVQNQVLDYLRQRRAEGKEERMLCGLAPLIEDLDPYKQTLFIDIMGSVATILKTPLDPHELVSLVENLKQRAFRLAKETQSRPSMVQPPPRPPSYSQPLYSQESQLMPRPQYPGPTMSNTGASYVAGPRQTGPGLYLRELMDL